jgi:hypothetical protein
MFLGPGVAHARAVRDGLAAFEAATPRTEVVVISADDPPPGLCPAVSWLRAPTDGVLPPFLVRYTDGAVYALICDYKAGVDGVRMFHTDDRSVVEFLAFRLQRELALPELG